MGSPLGRLPFVLTAAPWLATVDRAGRGVRLGARILMGGNGGRVVARTRRLSLGAAIDVLRTVHRAERPALAGMMRLVCQPVNENRQAATENRVRGGLDARGAVQLGTVALRACTARS